MPDYKSTESEEFQPGDVVKSKVRTFVWTERHLKGSELEPWRHRYDSVADAALAALPSLATTGTCPTSAPFDLIQHHMHVTPVKEQHPDIVSFWTEVTSPPPWSLKGISLRSDVQDRQYNQLVEAGQQVYTTYAAPISLGLLYYSLAGGFSSPRITRVLELTSYLVPQRAKSSVSTPSIGSNIPAVFPAKVSPSDERTFERLAETAQWAMACMDGWMAIVPPEDPTKPPLPVPEQGRSTVRPASGEAWADTVRVRLLHAQMRQRVLAREKHGGYNRGEDGMPLNVEDMAATLASFAVAPIWCMKTMGLSLTAYQREAYLALWRHLGFYLGLPSDILHSHFGTWASADAFLESVTLHLFTFDEDPAVIARLPTIPVLRAVAAKGGLGAATRPVTDRDTQLGYHLALSWTLLGPALGAAVGLPVPTWKDALRVRATFLAMAGPIWFGRIWRGGWERKRSECIRRALPRVVAWMLGRRRTTFWAGSIQGVARTQADRRWDNIDIQAEEWIAEGRWITRHWKLVWREMMAVVGSAIVVGLSTIYITYRRF